jgi:hypothetical protein
MRAHASVSSISSIKYICLNEVNNKGRQTMGLTQMQEECVDFDD